MAISVLFRVAAAETIHDDPHHRPAGGGEREHMHAHPGVDLTHPIVTESPLPETHVRLDYAFANDGGNIEHGFQVSGEYAFIPEFSIEAALPYSLLDPENAGPIGGIADAVLAVKLATYRLADHHVIPAIGVEVVLPTGNEERGIGNDHVVELEPFVRAGMWVGSFELIGTAAIGVPLNQDVAEDDEEDFAVSYNLSTLYHLTPDLQALLEFHGETIVGDADVSTFFLSPGVTFQPFEDKSITIGVGATVPVTQDKPFDYAVNLMTIVHF
jgi:hypothetical protein